MKQLNPNRIAFALLASSASLFSFENAFAVPAKKTPTKPPTVAAKPTPKPSPKLIREVMGTEQLVGYEGELGQTFTVGKATPFNLTLKKAEYSTNRINIGGNTTLPSGDQKLLVLHFTVHNPRKEAFNFSPSYLTIKAVDSSGVSRPAITDLGREITQEPVNYLLQPGQKIDIYGAVTVAAYGEVPKLIVQNSYDHEAPIVRYDLRGKVAKLPEPIADPEDTKGATARKLVPSKTGVFYPVADLFDVRIDSVSYTPSAIKGYEPDEGQRYFVATATIKNASKRAARISQSYFRADLKDADGEKASYRNSLLKGTRDEEADAELAPGEETRVRFYWSVPGTVEAKTILLQYGYDENSRTYAIDVKGAE